MSEQAERSDSNQQVRERREKEKFQRETELKDLQNLLSQPAGRRFIWRTLEFCGVYRQSATQSGSWTYFNEGQRSVGNMVLADIMEANADAYILMMKENKEIRK